MAHARRPRWLVCLSGLLVCLAGAESAAAAGVALEYEVYWKFLRLLEFRSVSEVPLEGPARIATESRTVGIVDTFFPWTGRAEAGGRVAHGALKSSSYHSWSRFRGAIQQVDVSWKRGVPRVHVSGEEPEGGTRDAVPADLQRNTIDPLSAVAELARGLARDGKCGGRFPVFDGLRRYDLVFADRGAVDLESSGKDPWSGPARLCEARFRMLGGGWRGDVKPEDNPNRILAWLRPVYPGSGPVPVRFRIEAEAGALDVHLRAASPEASQSPPAPLAHDKGTPPPPA